MSNDPVNEKYTCPDRDPTCMAALWHFTQFQHFFKMFSQRSINDLFKTTKVSSFWHQNILFYVSFNDALNTFLINGYIGVGNILIEKNP